MLGQLEEPLREPVDPLSALPVGRHRGLAERRRPDSGRSFRGEVTSRHRQSPEGLLLRPKALNGIGDLALF
jgi:hypothetical protein